MPDNHEEEDIIFYGSDEMETGVFSMIITWIQMLRADGVEDYQARIEVADYLDRVSEALRSHENTEGNTTND